MRTLSELIESEERYKRRRADRMNKIAPIKIIKRPRPELLDYNTAKKTFWNCYKDAISTSGEIKPIINNNNVATYSNLVKYYTRDPATAFNIKKGLFLVGEYGSGKSKVLKALQAMAAAHPGNIIHRPIWSHYKAYKKRAEDELKLDQLLNEWARYDLIIDDIGYEEDIKTARVNSFGTVVNIVQEIVRARYELYCNTGVITHFTSNKPFREIKDLYGAGTSTRLMEMTTQILWYGENLR